MITLNEIKVNEVVYLNGKIGQKGYSVELTEELKEALISLTKEYNAAATAADAQKVLDQATELVNKSKSVDQSSLVDVLEGDLKMDKKTGKYHVISDGKTGKKPVHQFIVDKMIEANDKGISPKPWLIFWVRLMRNKMFANSDAKVDNFMKYMQASYVDKDHRKELEEEGYSEDMAKELATHDQISITEQGILAAFKYVRLLTTKYEVVINEEGVQEIKQVDRFKKSDLKVDENTGEVLEEAKDILPEHAEEFVFEPPMMGQGGDAFTSKDIDDASDQPKVGHIVQVGKIHELPKGFDQVNCNDSTSCVKGLHLGGYYYVEGFSGRTNYLVDCLVAPEDVGAVCDVSRGWGDSEGAIRCKRYMVTGGHFAVSKGMYHPSSYAALLDTEWEEVKQEAIANLEKAKAEINDQL